MSIYKLLKRYKAFVLLFIILLMSACESEPQATSNYLLTPKLIAHIDDAYVTGCSNGTNIYWLQLEFNQAYIAVNCRGTSISK